MQISKADFDYVSQLIRTEAAIVIEAGKEYLVETRLTPLARQEGFPSLEAFVAKLRLSATPNGLHNKVVHAMTTNETFFFRDHHPFETLRRIILPEIIAQRAQHRKLNIWCGASSTGQEPYSIAMLIKEHFRVLDTWNVNILATDLSHNVLATARAGEYTQFEVNRGLPAPMLVKYFTKREAKWCLREEVKRMVEFRHLNLLQPWPIMPAFDLVFLRNVLIYFDVETKRQILKRVRSCLLPSGHLFLGTAETTINLDPKYQPVTHGNTVAYKSLP